MNPKLLNMFIYDGVEEIKKMAENTDTFIYTELHIQEELLLGKLGL